MRSKDQKRKNGKRFNLGETGASTVEYALVIFLVVCIVGVGIQLFRPGAGSAFQMAVGNVQSLLGSGSQSGASSASGTASSTSSGAAGILNTSSGSSGMANNSQADDHLIASDTGGAIDKGEDSFTFSSTPSKSAYTGAGHQCGGSVNHWLQLSGTERMGNSPASKMDRIPKDKNGNYNMTPIAGGYFVMPERSKYGHVGMVEKITDKGIYISDYNNWFFADLWEKLHTGSFF